MSGEELPTCIARLCDKPADGVGPYSGFALCQQHLVKAVLRLEKRQGELFEKLDGLTDEPMRQALRLEQQALTIEMQEIADMFDAVQEKLQQWRDKVMSRVQVVHDSVAGRLRDAAEAEKCKKEVSVACDAGDMRRVMDLTVSVETWLDEICERSIEFDRARSELRDRQNRLSSEEDKDLNLRSVGDVSTGVQQLQFMIDRHMTDVMQQCWLDDAWTSAASPPVCRFVTSIEKLPRGPRYIAVCTNTAGFVGDASGRVIRAESAAEDCVPLPQPCVFVAFDRKSADHLLVTPLDGAVRLQCHCDLDWSKFINGLHCDNSRQLLFVAQDDAVTVTDLTGRIVRVVNSSLLGCPVGKISGMDCNRDKVFVLVLSTGEMKVQAFGNDSGQLESSIDVSAIGSGGLRKLLLQEGKILLADWRIGQVHKVCGVTGQLIESYPSLNSSRMLQWPLHMALDGRGLLFVSELNGHVVQTFSSDGEFLETLGSAGQSGVDLDSFNCPASMAVVDGADQCKCLLVADYANRRLCFYRLV